MAERRNAEMGLVDGITAGLGGPRTAALLDRLDATIPWSDLVAPILALPEYQKDARGKGGRPAWPAITMLKCVLLAGGSGSPTRSSKSASRTGSPSDASWGSPSTTPRPTRPPSSASARVCARPPPP